MKSKAETAYATYVEFLEGMVPAGLAVPPHRLQVWEELPGPVRDAWEAAVNGPKPVAVHEPETHDSKPAKAKH